MNDQMPIHPDVIANRRATALAEINKMQQDLILAHDEIATLKRDLDRADDRLVLLNEERNKFRTEAHVFRNKLIELATQMANINLLTVKATEIMTTVNALIAADQTEEETEAEQRSAAAAVANLPETDEQRAQRALGIPEEQQP